MGKVPFAPEEDRPPCYERPDLVAHVVSCGAGFACPSSSTVSIVQTSGTAADKSEPPMRWQLLEGHVARGRALRRYNE